MKRIATRMIGGVITSTIMTLVVYPAIHYMWRPRSASRQRSKYNITRTGRSRVDNASSGPTVAL